MPSPFAIDHCRSTDQGISMRTQPATWRPFSPALATAALALSFLALLPPALAQGGSGEDNAMARCQQRLEISAAALVESYFDEFQTCTSTVLHCVQEEDGDERCLSDARAICASELGWTALKGGGPVETFVAQVATECAPVDSALLFGENGLAHGTMSCSSYGDAEASTLDELTGCIGRQHLCRALQLVSMQVPRARELLALGGVDLMPLGCLTDWEARQGTGLLARGEAERIFGDNKRLRRSKRAAQAVTRCQASVAWTGLDYARGYLKNVRSCLAASRACLGEELGQSACQSTAHEICAVQMNRIRGGERSLSVSFPASLAKGCAPSTEPGADQLPLFDDLLDPAGLGFRSIAGRCTELGHGGTDSLETLSECLLADHECRLEQMVLRENPRAAELFRLGGIDPEQFACLKLESSAICGDGLLEDFEECDPPGSSEACGPGSRCSLSCECAGSGPPVITASPLSARVREGEAVLIEVSATDPDGDKVAISASPRIEGASFVAHAGTEATGVFTFTPGFTQQGHYALTFSAVDPTGLRDQVTVPITIDNLNQAPTLDLQESALVDEGQLLTVPVTGSDPDGDLLSFTAAPLPDNAIFMPATGTLTFTPDYEQSGTYSITFDVSDGTLWAGPKELLITVQDVSTGGEGEPSELILEVDPVESPTLVKTQKITGRVNPTGEEPPPARITSSLITSVRPATGEQGQALEIQLSGETSGDHATHFVDGLSRASFGKGVSVTGVHVISASEAAVSIVIDSAAAPGTRQIMVTTEDEVAVSVLAFNLLGGHAQLGGRLVEADSGEPVTQATVSFEGNALETAPDDEGRFLFASLAGGPGELIVNAPDHDLLRLPVDLPVGKATDLADLRLTRNVYDPNAAAGISLHSVLGRGVADLTGRLSVAEARQTILDTILLVGGSEAGVLDAYGNQLNPAVEGDGLMTLEDKGVGLYADRLSKGESVTLIELLAQMSFAFDWPNGPPRIENFLSGLQAIVDDAWTKPNDPNSAATIAIFNPDGHRLSPNPPILDGSTTLNRFQAHLALGGFMGAAAKRILAKTGGAVFHAKEGESSGYTFTWEELLDGFGSAPSGPSSSTASGDESELADYEEVLREYYLDFSDESQKALKEILLREFSSYGLEEFFKENPYGVKEAYDNLLRISENDHALWKELVALVQDIEGSAGVPNLWTTMSVEKGYGFRLYQGSEYFPEGLKLHLISTSWAPGTPVIYLARETVREFGPPDHRLRVPAVKIVFYRSGDDQGDDNAANTDFHYRLWRIERKDSKGVDPDIKMPGQTSAQLVMVGFGKIEDPPADGRAPHGASPAIVPSGLPHASRMAEFEITLPPAGMNYYRIDVIRRRGNGTPMGKLDPNSTEYQQRFLPWMAGYLDDPRSFDPVGSYGRQHIHPGQGYLNSYQYEISPLSKATAVFIAGVGNIGPVDLAADYSDSSKVYLSVPGFIFDEASRGSGAIFRYDAKTEELSQYLLPGFLAPGQNGLAMDNHFNLYTVNAASEPTYGGRIFRYLGYRGPDDPPYEPEYYLSGSGEPYGKLHVGQVNYYSRLIATAQPSLVSQITMGPSTDADRGPELYIAETMKNEIKRMPPQAPEFLNWDSWHNSAQLWAWNSKDRSDMENALHFDPLTDIAFASASPGLYATQGSRVLHVNAGKDGSRSITTEGTIFSRSSGVAVCSSRGGDVVFVSDFGPSGEKNGVIYRIPAGDIPFHVPSDDPAEIKKLQDHYLFLSGLDHPTQLRITDSGGSFVFADAKGLRFKHFGFTGRAVNTDGDPLVGAVVTLKTSAGTQSVETDAKGYYHFTGQADPAEAVVYATITHPDHSYFERANLTGKCNANDRPAPCVSISSPADGTSTLADSTGVQGTVFPKDVDYSEIAARLDVTRDGETTSYPLEWTGHYNDFVVPDVSLEPGSNAMVVWLDRAGDMGPGSSLTTHISRAARLPDTQAASGIITNDEYRPRQGVELDVLVDGEKVARTITDECGYYNEQGLPLGELSIVVVEEE